jgi:hypothetical protein
VTEFFKFPNLKSASREFVFKSFLSNPQVINFIHADPALLESFDPVLRDAYAEHKVMLDSLNPVFLGNDGSAMFGILWTLPRQTEEQRLLAAFGAMLLAMNSNADSVYRHHAAESLLEINRQKGLDALRAIAMDPNTTPHGRDRAQELLNAHDLRK